jgi:carbonic anhydrase
MNRLIVSTLLAGAALAASPIAMAQAHWTYEGEAGPENWGKLDPKFVMCGIGRNQSPIDLSRFVEAELAPLKVNYKAAASEIVNNGHTLQVNYTPGSTLVVDGREFELKQFHFHAPSENTLNGKHFPLEGHLVHADKDGNLAVLAVMFSEGAANPLLAKLWQHVPPNKGDQSSLPAGLNAKTLLPTLHSHYAFNGSLTTPPCSEGVRWLVIKQPATASKAQVERFSGTVGEDNNRPVQPINARAVLR